MDMTDIEYIRDLSGRIAYVDAGILRAIADRMERAEHKFIEIRSLIKPIVQNSGMILEEVENYE